MQVTDILSIQLYTLRSLNDLDKVLDAVGTAGYRYVEGIGSYLDDATAVKAKVDARGLRFSSSHVSLAALRERPQAIIDACRLLSFQHLFMPAVPPEQRDADAAFWRSLGRELGALSQRFADAGIQLGYHNHNWELKPKDGSTTALELMFAEAEGTPLTWQADVAWLVRGGAEPATWGATAIAWCLHMSKTSHPRGPRWTRTAGPMSALACWTGNRCGSSAAAAAHIGWWWSTTSPPTRPAPRAPASRI